MAVCLSVCSPRDIRGSMFVLWEQREDSRHITALLLVLPYLHAGEPPCKPCYCDSAVCVNERVWRGDDQRPNEWTSVCRDDRLRLLYMHSPHRWGVTHDYVLWWISFQWVQFLLQQQRWAGDETEWSHMIWLLGRVSTNNQAFSS